MLVLTGSSGKKVPAQPSRRRPDVRARLHRDDSEHQHESGGVQNPKDEQWPVAVGAAIGCGQDGGEHDDFIGKPAVGSHEHRDQQQQRPVPIPVPPRPLPRKVNHRPYASQHCGNELHP